MHAVRAVLFLLAAIALSGGCGGSGAGEVSGTVTYDGKIVEQGTISFVPADGSGPTSGAAITDGKYSVQKVPVGKAKVTIEGVKSTGKKKMYDDPKAPLVQTSEDYIPAKYNKTTELLYEVKSGLQTKDFELAK